MTRQQLLVVGGGVAGCNAAIEAARLGVQVTIIDEHPQGLAAMSLDAPYFYGARLSSALSDEGLIANRVLGASDLLMECLEAGVEVLTGTCVWGAFLPGANCTHQNTSQLGLADQTRSWMVDYDYAILAPGSRDLVLSFPGWHLPGVLGVNGATALISRYQALGGTRIVILGSGNVGLRAAKIAIDAQLEVLAIVEVAATVQGDALLAASLEIAGVPFILSHTVQSVIGDGEVSAIRLVAVSDLSGAPTLDARTIECDTVCMAFGAVPNVELAAVAGCKLVFRADLGGWVPEVNAEMQTTLPSVFVVGDAAGVTETMHLDPGIAARQGRMAARSVASRMGLALLNGDGQLVRDQSAGKANFPPGQWLRSLVAAGGGDVIVCQCEEVSRSDLLHVRPPRYLSQGMPTPVLATGSLSATGQTSQDVFKKLTRVGMGHCQGKRCREHAMLLMADAAGVDLSSITPGSYRPPVRPLPLRVMWADDESEAVRQTWPTWLHPVQDETPQPGPKE